MGEFHVVYEFTGRGSLDAIDAAHAVVRAMERYKVVDLRDQRVVQDALLELGDGWDRSALFSLLQNCGFSQEVVGWYDYEFADRTWCIVEVNGRLGVDGLGDYDSVDEVIEAIKEKAREDDEVLARQKGEEYRDWCRSGKD